MKKLFLLALVIVVGFAALSFAACTDTSDLETRIAELERQLQAGGVKGEKGDPGVAGPVDPQGPVGPQGGSADYDDSALKERIAELEALLDPTQTPIYELGETFAYVSAGIPLFSIKVEITAEYPDAYTLTLTNFNMPNAQKDTYIRCKSRTVSNSWGEGISVDSDRLNIGEVDTTHGMISFYNKPEPITHFYFGIPIGANDIIPYAIFKVV